MAEKAGRIAAELKRRITAGELRPGDKVPSTRQLAREWNVATATAAKALSLLAQDGVLRPEPRVGNIVTGPPAEPGAQDGRGSADGLRHPASPSGRPSRGGEPELSRARVIEAAIEIADAEGLAALSMRGIASKLGVATMSLYRHVPGKDRLVELMAGHAYGTITYPHPLPEHWRARLEMALRSMWALYRRHPWLAQVATLSRPLVVPELMTHAEMVLSALDGHGLSNLQAHNLQILLYNHVQGLAVHLERAAQEQAHTGLTDDEWMETQNPGLEAIARSGRHPVFTRITTGLGPDYDFDFDEFFAFSLIPLLNGVESLMGGDHGHDPRLPRPSR
ncbi:TetR/AcrR family transcriptional regulator C-terminal domain-containing protein [Nonomuraea sp. NBC_01738]|uniref:TetR/AcrR family transcriptional regulator C-terminal domain-containing protein n=1 Tax=Nonomuraea sp. NBC_01738 TaxID=2976003 RepID=UPI002E160864|nr:TetR/AcrR family transcriptional regulator C-terminal domain-containing protein [Nonomuraea sp. NBC_01738]